MPENKTTLQVNKYADRFLMAEVKNFEGAAHKAYADMARRTLRIKENSKERIALKKSATKILQQAVEDLKKYNFTKGFFGTNGVDKKHGFTTPDPAEAMIKKAAMERCRTCYILADSSKIGQIAPVTFAKFDQAKLITTELTDKDLKKEKNIVEVKA